MKSQNFIEQLNNYIETNTDEITTLLWAKWIKGENGYPTLDFNTIWDGTKWVTKE